jgi:hypothetical protein
LLWLIGNISPKNTKDGLAAYRIRRRYRIIWAGLLTMPNPAKQLERHSWAAGYADGYIDGLEEAWARINAAIERGPMPQREKDEYRNGLLFACKLIASPSR